MTTKLDIKDIQYMNLFSMMTRTSASDCFEYNNCIIFVVKPELMKPALGSGGMNARALSARIRRRVKIIKLPAAGDESERAIERFILSIVHPIRFKRLALSDGEIIIFAPAQSKATLLGREGCRLLELKDILKKYFNIVSLRVI